VLPAASKTGSKSTRGMAGLGSGFFGLETTRLGLGGAFCFLGLGSSSGAPSALRFLPAVFVGVFAPRDPVDALRVDRFLGFSSSSSSSSGSSLMSSSDSAFSSLIFSSLISN